MPHEITWTDTGTFSSGHTYTLSGTWSGATWATSSSNTHYADINYQARGQIEWRPPLDFDLGGEEEQCPPISIDHDLGQGDDAIARANALLERHLSEWQLSLLKGRGWFIATGNETGRRYRIRRGWVGNVDVIDDDNNVSGKYCIHPACLIPTGDLMLLQKLMIESDERRFLATANKLDVYLPYQYIEDI